VQVYIKREDLLHPTIPGNKWRKIRYNLQQAQAQGKTTLLTFGGAYSNHIAAVAAAGREFNFQTIGFIRGEAHLPLNPTLTFATSCGMQVHYLDRETYRHKNSPGFTQEIQRQHPEAYVLPEGGTNLLAIKGCTEIIKDIYSSDFPVSYDHICAAVGTGGTVAGIIAGLDGKSHVIGFPALKGGAFLKEDITKLIQAYNGKEYNNWELQTGYHFGGYAKIKPDLITFIHQFKATQNIQLEPVYTGKMMFGLYDLIRKDYFKRGAVIVAIHSGGLQGIAGFEERLNIRL
jgi:1-aminocyclopropane-1-carboxylate deaminase/D-cysteine desulfhydrase-like pyridoxal-dependent ACC family enzyme